MEHQNSHLANMLRAYARQSSGLPLKPSAARQLATFIRKMDKLNAVVDYNDQDGLYRVPRREGIDEGYVRNPLVP